MSRNPRTGLTLVELLVVISIVITVLTLTVVYVMPAFQDSKNVQRGIDRIITTLLIAKQRALRDQRPVGVRFYVDTDNFVRRMRYVEQPDLLFGRRSYLGNVINPLTGVADGHLLKMDDIDLVGNGSPTNQEDYLIQSEDWIRIGAQNYMVITTPPPVPQQPQAASWPFVYRPTPGQLTANPFMAPMSSYVWVSSAPTATAVTGPFQVIRQPRPITGEDEVELPQNVVINRNVVATIAPTCVTALRTPSSGPFFEVLFGPTGRVINATSTSTLVIWVHDETKPIGDNGTARLIGIAPQTGLIGSYEINPNPSAPPNPADPLLFALDGKTSGL